MFQSEVHVMLSVPPVQTPWAIWIVTGWVTFEPFTETDTHEFPEVVCWTIFMHSESASPVREIEKVLKFPVTEKKLVPVGP